MGERLTSDQEECRVRSVELAEEVCSTHINLPMPMSQYIPVSFKNEIHMVMCAESPSAFAALAFFGGTIYNRVGIKVCLMFGGFGYACLSSAYFLTAHIRDRATGWIVAAGCIEGLSAAMVHYVVLANVTAADLA